MDSSATQVEALEVDVQFTGQAAREIDAARARLGVERYADAVHKLALMAARELV